MLFATINDQTGGFADRGCMLVLCNTQHSSWVKAQVRSCALVQDEAGMLRRALNESMRRVESLSDEGLVQVDRRIVVKLLVTFFQKGQSQEVLSLMARILAFTGQTCWYCKLFWW